MNMWCCSRCTTFIGSAGQGSSYAVRGVCKRRSVTAAGVGNSICGLCSLATRVVAGRSAGGAVELLAAAARRGVAGAGVAGRQTATGRAEVLRRAAGRPAPERVAAAVESTEPARRLHVVHDLAGRFSGPAFTLHETG